MINGQQRQFYHCCGLRALMIFLKSWEYFQQYAELAKSLPPPPLTYFSNTSA